MMRKVVIGLSVVVAIAAATVLGAVLHLRSSLPQENGSLVLSGLRDPVEIVRDKHGIPHIHAKNDHDAYFALGFVHAQDRLWQMEFNRRLGVGRLAEILGEPGLRFDRYLRTIGIYRLAEESYGHIPDEIRQALDAYAAGVNGWLSAHRGALPPEFLLLGFEPEQWKPADSLVWPRLMALRLGQNWRIEALRARIVERLREKGLPTESLAELWPESPDIEPATVESARLGAVFLEQMRAAIPTANIAGGASNSWAVHDSRTATGKPILANDPHLAFELPVLYYLARIESPELTVTGATFPGAPFMIFGHNGRIAWGITNGFGDAEDLFIETTAADDPDKYLAPGGEQEFLVREETIFIKGGKTERLLVRQTRHGPVISDTSTDAEKIGDSRHVVALASPMFRTDDRTVEAIYWLNRASDWAEFRVALKMFHAPHQNFMFASAEGDIGFIAAGRIPIRASGDGRYPALGADSDHDWLGFVDFDALPQVLNPASGRLVNANNRSVADDNPHLISRDWVVRFRAERILERLDAMAVIDVSGTEALQQDVTSAAARRLLPLMLAFEPKSERSAVAHRMLSGWDFAMRRNRLEPLIYTAWLRQLVAALADDDLGADLVADYLAVVTGPSASFVEHVLSAGGRWCDDVGTEKLEDCQEILDRSLSLALDELAAPLGADIERWRWGAVHQATFAHRIFTRLPLLNRFADLSIESDGGDHTVNRGTTPRGRPGQPFNHVDGSSFRAIYDLADLDNSRFVIATGQSGNPLSRHYGDFLERWRDGKYVRIGGSSKVADKSGTAVLTLLPNGG